MYKEDIVENGINELSQSFFRETFLHDREYTESLERDVWQEMIKEKNIIRTKDRRRGDSGNILHVIAGDWFWSDSGYRHMTDLTTDVVDGLAPLVT